MGDKVQELRVKNRGTRVLEAIWPGDRSVCGRPATRTKPFAKGITYTDATKLITTFDDKATLLALDVRYCDEHRDGVDFGNVLFDTTGDYSSYGILFRSLAYRVGFRRLNPWPWAGMVPPVKKP